MQAQDDAGTRQQATLDGLLADAPNANGILQDGLRGRAAATLPNSSDDSPARAPPAGLAVAERTTVEVHVAPILSKARPPRVGSRRAWPGSYISVQQPPTPARAERRTPDGRGPSAAECARQV